MNLLFMLCLLCIGWFPKEPLKNVWGAELFSKMDYSTTLEKQSKNNPKRSVLAKCRKWCRWKALERELSNCSYITAAKAKARGQKWKIQHVFGHLSWVSHNYALSLFKCTKTWMKLKPFLKFFSGRTCSEIAEGSDGNWEDQLSS